MNKFNFGRQYELDDTYKAAARLHQSRFRENYLQIPEWRDYGNRLPTAAALAGKNFYAWPTMLDQVAERFSIGDKKLYWDMLASDHIPFNFFVPLRGHPLAIQLCSKWVTADISEVLGIEIEWAPKDSSLHLEDRTSFDVYIEYKTIAGNVGIIGIEVKYTEREYSWGKTERERMLSEHSKYHHVHEASGLYASDAKKRLATPELKQFWRNQLLGESMLQQKENMNRPTVFTSVLLYPAGNEHFGKAAKNYSSLLAENQQHRFVAVTYEEFFASIRSLSTDTAITAWVDYLEARYIVHYPD